MTEGVRLRDRNAGMETLVRARLMVPGETAGFATF
jgi:hypothetical protein